MRVLQAISDDERIINNIYNNFPADWPSIENMVHKSTAPSFDVSQGTYCNALQHVVACPAPQCTDRATGTQRYTLAGDTKLRIYACKYRQVVATIRVRCDVY